MVLTADLRNLATLDRDLDRYTLVGGASIYPFAWSLLLAAHDVGARRGVHHRRHPRRSRRCASSSTCPST